MRNTRLFLIVLAAIALASLVPLLILASSEAISYDGYWYLFIDTQNRWKLFLSEYRANAHPIIYQLLLRLVARFGHSRLLLRSLSIIPGAASVVVLGLVAKKLCRSRAVALLAAAAYAFSMVMIEINIDVRSYPLCLLFVLIAFLCLVNVLQHSSDKSAARALLGYGMATSIAIGSEYYAVFFLLASLSYLGLLAATRATFRRDTIALFAHARFASAAALMLPFLTIAFFYLTHFRYQRPGDYGHLAQFYWVHGTAPSHFILHNLRADLNYMLPVEARATGVTAILTLVLFIYGAYFALFRKAPVGTLASGLPALMTVLLIAELIILSLLRKYPFGGYERQQSIFFPFLILAAFVLLDQLIAFSPVRWVHITIVSCVALLIAINFRDRWQKTPRSSTTLFLEQHQAFVRNVPPVTATYVDQFSLIAYYIYTHNFKWKFDGHLHEPDRVDEYSLTEPSGNGLLLFRDLDQWNFDLHNPQIYEVLAHTLSDAHVSEINLFTLKQVPGPTSPGEIAAEKNQIVQLASQAHLRVVSIYDTSELAGITLART